jgi:hypothetical protein
VPDTYLIFCLACTFSLLSEFVFFCSSLAVSTPVEKETTEFLAGIFFMNFGEKMSVGMIYSSLMAFKLGKF